METLGKLVINFWNALLNFFELLTNPFKSGKKLAKAASSFEEKVEQERAKIQKDLSKQWLPSFPSATQATQISEQANLEKIKDNLQPCLNKIQKLINDTAAMGKKEVYLPFAIYNQDNILRDECFKVMKSAGYTLIQNSMTNQWVIRW